MNYLIKRGLVKSRNFLRGNLIEYSRAWIGSFIGIGLIALFHSRLLHTDEMIFLIGSFGASSVLLFGSPHSPFSKPRNLIGGHLISSFAGVLIYTLFPSQIYLSAPLAVSISILLMQFTNTLHPPGGATALIAIIGSAKVKSLGFWFVLTPVLSGVVLLWAVSIMINYVCNKYRKSI